MKTIFRIISLPDDSARRERISRDIAESGVQIDWQFFDASRKLHPHLLYGTDAAFIWNGRPLSRGELGCYSSHFAAWREFLASDADQIILLEDDVMADWAFLERLSRFDLGETSYLRLSALALPPHKEVGTILGRRLLHCLGFALGAQGYMLTKAGAENLVKRAIVVRMPVDDLIDRQWWPGCFRNMALFPYPVVERAGDSRIGSGRNDPVEFPNRLRIARTLVRIEEKIRFTRYKWLAIH